jgi:hypothetical protein
MQDDRLSLRHTPRDEQADRAAFLRILLLLDTPMLLFPNLTLRLLSWADPDLAALMGRAYT